MPTPSGSNPNRLVESLKNVSADTALAYHGLRAIILRHRIARTESHIPEAFQEAEFYDSLNDQFHDVVHNDYGGLNVFPIPAEKFKGPDSYIAKSQSNILFYRQQAAILGPGVDKPEMPKATEPLTPVGRDVDPVNSRQRKHERKLAETVHTIREERDVQRRRSRVHGSAGKYSAWKTNRAKADENRNIKHDYRSGSIDSFERLERKEANDKTAEYNMSHPIHKAEKRLERREKSGKIFRKREEKASNKWVTLRDKRINLYDKLADRLELQQNARDRRIP